MAPDNPEARDSHITTDPDQIESWARETNTVPVRVGNQFRLVKEGQFDDERMDRLDWDAFEAEIADSDRVVVYREDDERDPLQVRHRADAMTHLEGEDVEERLVGGEVVTGTVTDTATIERTVVEAAEIESEIVDSQVVDRTVVDAELVTRDCPQCDVVSQDGGDVLDRYHAEYFLGEGDDQFADVEDAQFELEVDEAWAVTFEEREEYVVESRIADVEVGETDEVEAVDVHSDVDLEGLHRQLIQSNLFEREFHADETIDPDVHAIESEIREDDRIRTTLTRDGTVEREVAMAHRVLADATESERTNVQTAYEEVVASNLLERDRAGASGTTTGTVPTGESSTAAESEAGAEGEPLRVSPTEDDEGKTVVDASGDEIGVVSEVRDGMAYVEPDPSITEKIMASLGWSDADEEDFPVGPDEIEQITDDQIELTQVQ